MSADLISRYEVARVLGPTRLRRLLRAGWLAPLNATRPIMFKLHDVRSALRRLERRRCPPDQIEVARVRLSELRNGHPRLRQPRKPAPGLDEIVFDFSGYESP